MSLLQEKFKAFDIFVDGKISGNMASKAIKSVKKEKIKPKTERIVSDVQKKKTPKIEKPKREKVVILQKAKTEKPHVIDKQPEGNILTDTQNQRVMKSYEVLKQEYCDMSFSSLVEDLRNIFSTPVEERSSALIHEKFPDGRIFGGRFYFNAQDGSKITVSQKLSKQIWNYKYYSITVEKGNSSYTVNLDFDNGRFINSTKDGKLLPNAQNSVAYVPKSMMLERNSDIVNLPQYMKEICLSDSTQPRKFIDFSIKAKTNESAVEQREREVEKVLRDLEKEDDSLL